MATLDGMTVLVTGGNSGIGQAAALAFAKEGATVVITGRRKDAVDEAVAQHSNIHGYVGDVSSLDDAKAAVAKAVEVGGGLDVLVNNAGVFTASAFNETAPEKIVELFTINVLGLSYVTQAAASHIIERHGSIINIGSGAGHMAAPGMSYYGATKAAVESLTKSWAIELAPNGVRVNCIAPGPVETPIFGKHGMTEEQIAGMKDQMIARVPLGRLGTPEDIAAWIVNLASPAGAWVTGQIFGIDGGASL